jgi:hypothetical protein
VRKLTVSISDEELEALRDYEAVKAHLAMALAEQIFQRLHVTLEVTMEDPHEA